MRSCGGTRAAIERIFFTAATTKSSVTPSSRMANRFPPASSQIPGMVPNASTGQTVFGGIPAGGHLLGHLPYTVVPQQHYQTIVMPPTQPTGALPVMMSGHLQGVYHLSGQPMLTAHPVTRRILPRSADEQRQWVEERQKVQERLVKERNYHIQQQRLRDFHSGGSRKLQADRLIQDMLGKLEEPRRKSEPLPPTGVTPHILGSKSVKGVSETQTLKLSSTSSNRFQPSQKARDWSNLGDLQNVFSAPSATPGLPQWCQEGAPVPAIYTQVENYITRNGVLDTSLLYPVLLSSGLSRETLGQIWSLANRQTPGMLTRSELFAVLALVALAQNACQITSLDILQTVQQPPTPLFNQVNAQLPMSQTVASLLSSPTSIKQSEDDDFDDFKSATDITIQSMPATMMVNSIGSRLANHHTSISPSPTNQLEHQDDTSNSVLEYKSFHCSGTPLFTQTAKTAVSTPSTTVLEILSVPPPITKESQTETMGGFEASTQRLQLQPNAFSSFTDAIKTENKFSVSEPSTNDLMSTSEDKYSVFRELEASINEVKPPLTTLQGMEDDFGDFLSGAIDPNAIPATKYIDASTVRSSALLPTSRLSELNLDSKQQQNDVPAYEFSEFQSASTISNPLVMTSQSSWTHDSIRTTPTVILPNVSSNENGQTDDFVSCRNLVTDLDRLHLHSNDDDFGDFVTPSAHGTDSSNSTAKTELDSIFLGNNYFKLKDSGSIESQSVSSLDFGSYDTQSGNELDRHGSVPSLDLKVSGGSEEDSGDSPVLDSTGASVPPASSVNLTRASEDLHQDLPSTMQGSTTQPFDRYSLMRAEKPIDTDIHSYEWQRCLDSCYNLIRDAFKIFNGISSSSISKEVIASEEGENYLKNIVEIYRIVLRISISSKRCKNLDPKLNATIKDIESQWNNLLSFIMGSSVFPSDECFDFSPCVLDQNVENLKHACGVCLLNVDVSNSTADDFKLMYGGRQYHATCANFWVNFVDSLLPSLAFKLN